MSRLFSPVTIGTLQLSNRIVVAPMCQYSCEHGQASDWHLMHLGQLAISGAGMLVIEATAVAPQGRITPHDLGLYGESTQGALARVLGSVRAFSAIPMLIQLAHAGRKASSRAPWDGGALLARDAGGWQTVAPSALPYGPGEPPPAALDDAGLAHVRASFVDAARRSAALGLDGIELHAAHGYLLHQFLSPLSNQRHDQYGGALANRMRFPLEIFDGVRAAFPAAKPVGVRLSATDWVDGGWDIAQSIELCKALERRGCSYLHVSSGGLSPLQRIPFGPGYQVFLAEQIRREVQIPVVAVGLITDADQAEAIVASGQADLVALARGMLYDPRWPWHAAARLGAQVTVPRQYWRCQPTDQSSLFGAIRLGQR